MHRCHIALGGNLGDVSRTFSSALERLAGPDLNIVAVSRLYATDPMGPQSGGMFLNAAATLETVLSPVALLERLLSIEAALGRTRKVHWGPRPIDLDLILFGNLVVEEPRLRVPHACCWFRRFVLDPLAEIAGDAMHPEAGSSIRDLRDRLLARPLPIGSEQHAAQTEPWQAPLIRRFPDLKWVDPEQASVRLRPGTAGNSAAERWIGVPSDGSRLTSAVEATLTALLGVPTPVEDTTWSHRWNIK